MAAKCPFCSGAVTEELARLGGNCPHCFNPIPGEEAATDPGVEAQQAEAEAQAVVERKQSSGRIIGLVLVLGAVIGFGGWTYYKQLQEEEEIALILMDDDDEVEFFLMDAEDIDSLAEAEAEALAEAAAKAAADKPVKVRQPKEDAGSFGTGADRLADNSTGTTSSGSGEGPSLDTTSMGPASLSTGPGIGISRKDLVLTDPTEIQQMAGTAIKRYSGQIKSCYETELKSNDSLRGSWTLTFTINPDGTTSQAAVKANNASDPGLEACMKRQVANWSFQKIAKAQPVGKTYRFGAR